MAENGVRSPYIDLPPSRFWRTGVTDENPLSVRDLYKRKFEISKTTRITTAGSCFAQHIGRRLKAHGFKVLNYEEAPPGISEEVAFRFGYDIFSARYGNIYLVRQLLQLGLEAFGRWSPVDAIWTKDGRFYDALRPGIEPDGMDSVDEVQAHRKAHLEAVRRLVCDTDLFIFTFGLTEAWVHRESQTVYPTAPGTIAGKFDPAVHEFKNFNFSEVLKDFLAFRRLLRSENPSVQFLLTVSPVPLTATASNDHVLAATTYSKSVLRAVSGHLSQKLNDVDYFPSYELISSHWSRGFFYESNLRSVSTAGVDAVMSLFFAEHDAVHATPEVMPDGIESNRANGELREQRRRARLRNRSDSREDVMCEEVMLEAFGR